MELKQLEYFVRVAELGSFTRAAAALNTTQPMLSRQVRMLEVELHQTLLTRNGRGAVPTEAGQLLLEHGRGILHQVERAREDLERVRGGLAGRVALGLPPSVARVLTVPLTRAFRLQLPQARLSISEGLSTTMQDGLTTGRLDIAVLYNTVSVLGLEVSPLMREELLLVQPIAPERKQEPPLSAITLQDIATLPLVIPSRPNAIRMFVESEMAALGRRPTIGLEIDGISAILDLVDDGAGCAILSRNAVTRSTRPSAFTVRPITVRGEPLRIDLSLAVSASRPTTLTQQATLVLLKETALSLL